MLVAEYHRSPEAAIAAERACDMDDAEKRGAIIRHLENTLALAEEIEDSGTGYLIERALDEARARLFRLIAGS